MSDHHSVDPALDLFSAFLQLEWQAFFDRGVLERGMRYADQGCIKGGINLEAGGELLMNTAQVAGSRKSPYQTRAAVRTIEPERGFLTHCSCPVGVSCKHAVALIQTFLSDMGRTGAPSVASMADRAWAGETSVPSDTTDRFTRDWEAWLDRLETTPGVIPGSERVGEESRPGLFLDASPSRRDPVLKVLPVWLRPSRQSKRHSGWVAPDSIEARPYGLVPAPHHGWSEAQEDALSLLLHGDNETRWVGSKLRHWSVVAQPFQARAFWALLDSDEPPLLFHEKQTGQQLALGPACELTLTWQAYAQGVQHLQADTLPPGVLSDEAIVVRVGRELCYLDPEFGRFGRMAGNPELLRQLRFSPPLPPEMSEW